MPIVLEVDRSGIVASILGQAVEDPKNLMVKFNRPYTIGMIKAELEGDAYVGIGCAKVCHPDEWSEKKGKSLVIMRAARQIADEFIAELERVEGEANALALDIGMAVMQVMHDEGNPEISESSMYEFIDRIINGSNEEEE